MSSSWSVLLLVVAVLVLVPDQTTAGMGKISEKSAFFKHYSQFVVMTRCFGEEVVNGWHMWYDNLLAECEGEVRQRRALRRAKRADDEDEDALYFSADKIRLIKNKMMNKILFVNCTMNKMNITVNAEGGVVTGPLIDYYRTLDIEEVLMEEVAEGLQRCGNSSSCAKYQSYGPIDADFQRRVKFIKCEKQARLSACVRKDLRLLKEQFDFEGLDGVLDDVIDEEDKVMAIMSAKAMQDAQHFFD